MSNIPRARTILERVLLDPSLSTATRRRISLALSLMTRVKYCRRAPAKRKVIDRKLRRQVRKLVTTRPELTMHEIANAVGLRSGGRVSEVMHGKR